MAKTVLTTRLYQITERGGRKLIAAFRDLGDAKDYVMVFKYNASGKFVIVDEPPHAEAGTFYYDADENYWNKTDGFVESV